MIAKALSREVRLFIFDEPTVGVDVEHAGIDLLRSSATCAKRERGCC